MPNDFDDDFSNEPIFETKIDIEKVKENVPLYTNEKLCEMIVCDRYFGFEQKVSPICMEELAKRRANGDTFNFEEYINKFHQELPVLNFTNVDIRAVLQQSINARKVGQ
jgi:hypothetical protein